MDVPSQLLTVTKTSKVINAGEFIAHIVKRPATAVKLMLLG
jgi:hypothetical protein